MNSHGESFTSELLFVPTVVFASIHDSNRDLTISRQPCSLEQARNWLSNRQRELGERVVLSEIRELKD